jgi:hypothetical protein
MKIIQDIKFFIPHLRKPKYESAYDEMKAAIKYQMNWTVTNRRIESLTYVSNRRQLTARIGEFGKIESQYEVVAILEAALYIIVTITRHGEPGPSILVNTSDVISVQDFKSEEAKPAVALAPAA